MRPSVTVAVPSYNQGRFLEEALASIFAQALPVEVFVMDGGSTDNSLSVIRQWQPKLAGWRSCKDNGQAAAINEGISLGSAPFVCWLNSDDYFCPGGLRKLADTLVSFPKSPFAYGRCWTVSESGKKLSPYLTREFSPRLLANFCFIAQPATLMTRAAWEHVGGLDENLRMALDYDLWWRLFKSFGKPRYCKDFVAATRMHKATKTAQHLELHYRESMNTVNRYWGTVPLKWRIMLPFMKAIRKLGM